MSKLKIKRKTKVNDIIQITDPDHQWYPALLIVSEIDDERLECKAYMIKTIEDIIYINLKKSEYETVGRAIVVQGENS